MPILQPLDPSTILGEMPGTPSSRSPTRVLLSTDGRASALDLRRLIAADPHLVEIGQAVDSHETLHHARDLQPDIVVVDRALSHHVVLLARELTSLDRPAAVVVRSACREPLLTIAAIIAGVRGIVSRSDPEGVICDAIRWVAGQSRWLPDVPLSALSRAGARLDQDDLPILLMLLRDTPGAAIAADLGITAASLGTRRAAMLRDMLGEPPLIWSESPWRTGASPRVRNETDPQVAIAA